MEMNLISSRIIKKIIKTLFLNNFTIISRRMKLISIRLIIQKILAFKIKIIQIKIVAKNINYEIYFFIFIYIELVE